MNTLKPKISKEVIRQIPANKLDTIIADNNYNIIDVRDQKGIEKQGSIPGAINIPFDTVERAINPNHQDYNPIFNGNGPYLFCCTGGVMSYMAGLKAQESGIKNVCNLDGGHSGWLKSKLAQTV
jgi:rhodanese-related sulfurtransferase